MHTGYAVFEGDEAYVRERLDGVGHVVVPVRDRIGARLPDDLYGTFELSGYYLGNFVEGMRDSGDGVEGSRAAVEQAAQGERGDIVHVNMVARLLAVAEERDLAVFLRCAAKTVRTVRIVRIVQSIDQRR